MGLVLIPQHLDLYDQWISYQAVKFEGLYGFCLEDNILLMVSMWSFSSLNRAITLENQLVILGTSVTDAGGYYVQAVNEKNGENKTSPFIHLSVAREYPNHGGCALTLGLQTGPTKAALIERALLTKDWTFKGGQCLLLGLEHTELLAQKRDAREEMPSTNHPHSPLSGGFLCARQVHDDIPHCLLWSCDYNFFLMQVFIMCCFPLCLSKQVILLSANLFMNLFPVYGIIFTRSYHRVPGNMHFIVIT